MTRRILIALALVGCLEPVERLALVDEGAGVPAPASEVSRRPGLWAQWSFHDPAAAALLPPDGGACGPPCSLTARPVIGPHRRNHLKAEGYAEEASAHGEVVLWLAGEQHLLRGSRAALIVDPARWTWVMRVRPAPIAWLDDPAAHDRRHAMLLDFEGVTWSIGPTGALEIRTQCPAEPMAVHCPADVGSARVVTRDAWHVVALSYGDGRLCQYLDGAPEGCIATGWSEGGDDAVLLFGVVGEAGRGAHTFPGAVDTVRLYQRGLDEAEHREEAAGLDRGGSVTPWPAPCAQADVGCADGVARLVDTGMPGISACAVEDVRARWGPALDHEACAPGWRVCTFYEVVDRSPSRVMAWLGKAGDGARLSQDACSLSDLALCERFAGPDSSCDCGGETYDGGGFAMLNGTPLPQQTPALAGHRWIRRGYPSDRPPGVLCCEHDACVDSF